MARLPDELTGPERLARRGEERLLRAFRSAGFTISRPSGPDSPDLVVSRGGKTYALEIKASAGRARRSVLRAFLADAILQARVKAEERRAEPLPVLVTDSVSDAIVGELDAYAQRYSGGSSWGILDERGRFDLRGPELDSVAEPGERAPPAASPAGRRAVSEPHNAFTDLGQWLLKVLVSPRIPERWLNAPRRPIRGIADLAEAGRVSLASASRIVAALEAGGFVAWTDGVVRLVRIEALLDSWRTAAQRPTGERHARFLLPAPDPIAQLRETLRSRKLPVGRARVCLGLFAACRELEVGLVRGAPVHLYAEDPSDELMEELALHPVEHRTEAEVVVRRPAFPEAVFRGCVDVRGVPVADILQCWLDVSYHPARGAEQAAEIASRLHLSELGE